MKPQMNPARSEALTVVELLMVIAICAVLLGLFLPMVRKGDRSPSTQCLNNLKQVALAQIVWTSEHGGGERFPFEVPASEGGLKEVVGERRDLVSYYRGLSNEIMSPKVLACPTDRQVKLADDFAALTPAGVSYFLNIGPTSTNVISVLNGDAQFEAGRGGPERLTGLVSLTNGTSIAWQRKIHDGRSKGRGNVATTDGAVMQMRDREFQEALFPPQNSNAPVRLLFP